MLQQSLKYGKYLFTYPINFVLKNPKIFQWQQKICNNYENIAREFKDYLNVPRQNILDIGCSTGAGADKIVDMKNNNYFGIDLSSNYIKYADQHYPNGNFTVMDAKDLQFNEIYFDIIMMVGFLHHLDDQSIRLCVKSIKKVIKKQGTLLIAEPVFTTHKPISSLLLHLDRGKHIRTLNEYKNLFKEFSPIQEKYFNFPPHRFCAIILTPK